MSVVERKNLEEPVRLIGTNQDIPANKDTGPAHRDTVLVNQLTLAAAIAKLGYWEFDVLNDVFTFNNQFYDIFKTTAEQVGGYKMSSRRYAELFVHPDEREIVGRKIGESINSDDPYLSYKTEHRVIYANGEIGHISVHFYIVKDDLGRKIKIFGVNQDITERKKAEEKIRESNLRFMYVTKATSDAIWDWDITNETVFWGEGFRDLFGYDPEDDKEDFTSWTKHIHPEDAAGVLTGIQQFIDGCETNWESQYRYLKHDQTYAYVIDKGFVIRDDKDKATRMVGAMRDVSKQMQAQENIQKHAKEVAASNAALEEFAYVASHDLQEPLRMITSFLVLLERKYADVLDSKGKQYIDFAVDGARRMRQIILDLLEYSRIGKLTDKQEVVDLNLIVKDILVLFRKQIEENNATIVVDKLPKIQGHKAPLRQVFQNLINNALKYSVAGATAHIHITVKELDQEWQFSVADNGIGIDKQYFDKIFVLFQRLHGRDQFSGTGLGLAITKKIIESQGGKIWLDSEQGKGTTFYFSLLKQPALMDI